MASSGRRRSNAEIRTVRDKTADALQQLDPWAGVRSPERYVQMTGTSNDAKKEPGGRQSASRSRAASESQRSSTLSSPHSRRPYSSGERHSHSSSRTYAPVIGSPQPPERLPTRPTPKRRVPPRPADIGYQPGDFIGGHDECLPANKEDRVWRAKMAEGAEKNMLRQVGAKGETLSELRKSYGNKMRFDAFAQDKEALVEYKMAGQPYYASGKPQNDPIEQVRARHPVGVQHEARMARMGVENPCSERVEGFATNGQKEIRNMSAVPKDEFDNMYRRCRDANKALDGKVEHFNIPNNRDDDQWFRVELEQGKKTKKKPVKTKAGGIAGVLGRFAKMLQPRSE